MVRENNVWTPRPIRTSFIFSCTVTETVFSSKLTMSISNRQITTRLWQKDFFFWVIMTYFSSSSLYWLEKLFIIETSSIKNGCFLSKKHFRILLGSEFFIWTVQCARKPTSKFLGACRCWVDRFCFCGMDQKHDVGDFVGYGDSYSEFIKSHSNVLRLYEKLIAAARTARSPAGKSSGYGHKNV